MHAGSVARGLLPAIVDPADGITPVTPSALTALVIKNGTDTGDSVTITAVGGGRVGAYKWSYDPAGDVECDHYAIVFTITIGGLPYYHTENVVVVSGNISQILDAVNSTYLKVSLDVMDGINGIIGYVSGLAAKFVGITLVADWLRRLARSDAGTAGMGTALTEINTGGTSTFSGTAHSLQAGAAGGSGDWTNDEKAQIRYQLGIDGTATAPTAPVTSPVVIVPSGAGKTTCYALCVDRRGDPKAGVAVHCWLAKTRPAGLGIIADDLVEVFTSGENGVVQIPDRMLGFSYAIAIGGTANPIVVRISPTAGETTAIPDLIS